MSGAIAICHISDDLKKTLRAFRFQKSSATNVIILKVDRESHDLVIEEHLEDCDIEEVKDELPSQQPRYLLISYQLKHSDGRISYPLCLVFYSPTGCHPEQQMLYAGSRNSLVQECELTKNFEIRDLDELSAEYLDSKLL
uniref:ADF-H domain-containing protein n=1 Tax=Steinernema glaseri TaxID=37863 RepID=A0A1I7YQH5_9BILA